MKVIQRNNKKSWNFAIKCRIWNLEFCQSILPDWCKCHKWKIKAEKLSWEIEQWEIEKSGCVCVGGWEGGGVALSVGTRERCIIMTIFFKGFSKS